MTLTSEAVQLFRLRNPLRRWREENSWPREDVAAELGCVEKTVRNWEFGDVQVPDVRFHSIGKLMGEDPGKLRKRWRQWFSRKP